MIGLNIFIKKLNYVAHARTRMIQNLNSKKYFDRSDQVLEIEMPIILNKLNNGQFNEEKYNICKFNNL